MGLSPEFALGFMFLNAWEPGQTPQYAGWRVLPHFYAPESWHLPVKVGLVAEFSFQNTRYEENSRRVELRPILDREFTRWEVVFNPVFERALHGPGTRRGWNFEPAMLLRWKRPVFSPSLEYYGEIDSINVPPRAQPEVHQLFVGGDWQVKPEFLINLGLGFDLGSNGPGLVLKSRFEWHWGKVRHPMRMKIVPILHRAPAFEALDDFSDFVESVSCETSKICQVRGSSPARSMKIAASRASRRCTAVNEGEV